jgi:hypothetical protein
MNGLGTGTAAAVSILVASACLLSTAFPLIPNLESLTTETCSLPLPREIHAAQEALEARPERGDYLSFAYSALASFRMGMSGSASLHKAKKSW